ncbi:MAG: DnaB-like helicase C-terminal domain-containing protein [Candidatus Paceibacterota bacterium]|jgi:replicative DNA helicase
MGERRLIGALLLDPERLTELSTRLTAEDFAFAEYATPFRAMCSLHLSGQPVNVDTVAAKLNVPDDRGRNQLNSIGGTPTLVACIEGASPGEVDFWVEETIKSRKRRQLNATLDKYKARIVDADDPDKLRNELEEGLVQLEGSESADVKHVSATSAALEDRIRQYIMHPDSITGLESGWTRFDQALDGVQPMDSIIVYAASGRFKSLFTQNWAYRFAKGGHPGLMYTTEMPTIQVQERMLQMETGFNLMRLRRADQIGSVVGELQSGLDEMASLPLYMSEGFDLTTSSMKAETKRQARWNGIEWVIVDLIDHVRTNKFKDDIYTQQSYIMQSIKDIAKKNSVGIISVAHIGKGDKTETRKVELPVEEIKGSSSKYQDVDIAMSIVPVAHGVPPERRYANNPPEPNWYGLEREEIQASFSQFGGVDVMVSITKNRRGETGRFRFWLDISRGGVFTLVE